MLLTSCCDLLQANRILAAQQHDGNSSLSHPGLMEQLRQQIGLTKVKFANAVRALKLQQTSLDSCLPSESAWSTAPAGGSHVTSIAVESVCSEDVYYATLAVQQALQQLPETEASFIQHMYGLQDGLAKNRTQVRHIAEILCVSHCFKHRVHVNSTLMSDMGFAQPKMTAL